MPYSPDCYKFMAIRYHFQDYLQLDEQVSLDGCDVVTGKAEPDVRLPGVVVLSPVPQCDAAIETADTVAYTCGTMDIMINNHSHTDTHTHSRTCSHTCLSLHVHAGDSGYHYVSL